MRRASTKDSGAEVKAPHLTHLPSDWGVVPLGEIVKSQYGLSAPASRDGNVPILGMQNIVNGRVSLARPSRVQLDQAALDTYRLRAGDILFNRTNSYEQVGKTAVFEDGTGEPFVFASYLIRLSTDRRRANPYFIAYYLNSPSVVNLLRAMATPGVSQYNINPTALGRQLIVPLPTPREQDRIAEVLRTWDDAETHTADLVSLKVQLKRALMQQLLTGERRFPEFAGPTWEEFHLGDMFEEREETGRSDLPLLSITADRGVIPRDEIDRRDSSSADKSLYRRIEPGDIGYNTMRMWQGVSALSTLEGIVSPAYTICVPSERVHGPFAAHLFKAPFVVHKFLRYSQGLVDDTLNLKFHHFAQIKLRFPLVAEQRRIAAVLDELDRDIALFREQLDRLKQQKQALMQKLLTGEIRVRAQRRQLH